MACADGNSFPWMVATNGELSELLAEPLTLGEPSLGIGFAGVAPLDAAYLEFETDVDSYEIDVVHRPDITPNRTFFIFAITGPGRDGNLRAFDANGTLLTEVRLRAPVVLAPGEMPPRGRP
jgi:hypothetical protein